MRALFFFLLLFCVSAQGSRVSFLLNNDSGDVDKVEKNEDFDKLEDYVEMKEQRIAHSPTRSPEPVSPIVDEDKPLITSDGKWHNVSLIYVNGVPLDKGMNLTDELLSDFDVQELIGELKNDPKKFDNLYDSSDQDIKNQIRFEQLKYNSILAFPLCIFGVFLFLAVRKYGLPTRFYKIK